MQDQPALEGNQCEKNGGAGIYYGDNAGGSAAGNVCTGNEDGIYVNDGAHPSIEQNTCSANRKHGICIGPKAAPAMKKKDNACERNGGDDVNDQRGWLKRVGM